MFNVGPNWSNKPINCSYWSFINIVQEGRGITTERGVISYLWHMYFAQYCRWAYDQTKVTKSRIVHIHRLSTLYQGEGGSVLKKALFGISPMYIAQDCLFFYICRRQVQPGNVAENINNCYGKVYIYG